MTEDKGNDRDIRGGVHLGWARRCIIITTDLDRFDVSKNPIFNNS